MEPYMLNFGLSECKTDRVFVLFDFYYQIVFVVGNCGHVGRSNNYSSLSLLLPANPTFLLN